MNPPQHPAAVPNAPDDHSLKPDLVSNIPMSQPNAPEHHENDLDKIMHEVSHEIKKNVQKPAKRHFLSRKPKAPTASTQPVLSAQPVPRAEVQIPVAERHPGLQPQAQPEHTPKTDHSKKTPKPKHDAKTSVPVFIILITIIVTGVLIVAAMAAYKQK